MSEEGNGSGMQEALNLHTIQPKGDIGIWVPADVLWLLGRL